MNPARTFHSGPRARDASLHFAISRSTIPYSKATFSENGFDYDAEADEYVDLMKAGIIDPVKVTKTALQNAASIAGTILTTEALVSDIPEKKQDMPMGGHDHGGGEF